MTKDRTPENVAQLRDRIDAGQSGDKIGFPDPAAAPLGTDAEAAGAPPDPATVRTAYREGVKGRPDSARVETAPRPIDSALSTQSSRNWSGALIVAALVVLAIVAVWVFL